MKIIITKEEEKQRIDSFLTDRASLSRAYVKTLIEENKILVNNNPTKASYKLKIQDVIDLTIPEKTEIEIQPENITLDIVYEDSELMVINKPAGMVTHPAPGVYSGTLVNAVLYHVKQKNEKLSGINGKLRPGIVHRLDKDTTGLILVAKSQLAQESLSKQIKDRGCKRIYQCIVQDNIKENDFEINKLIGRHPKFRNKMTTFNSADEASNARYALTKIKVLKRLQFKNQRYCLLECRLETGRTHQIRVHLSSIRHPVIGDITYGYSDTKTFNLKRPMLHAKEIGLNHPKTNERLSFSIDLPQDFQGILGLLE